MKWVLERIGSDLPNMTVHDVSHSDALWEMADLVLGESYPITPMEAFILGAAFLAHDAGMSAIARTGKDFESTTRWRDAVALTIRRRTGRTPSGSEITEVDHVTRKEVFEGFLRETHSEAIRHLITDSWSSKNGPIYLLDNTELRSGYGQLIGEVGASHWWAPSMLRDRFSTELGSAPGYPQQWTVNPLKIACALRVADAAHLDARRAPALLMALHNPIGVSQAHWIFQQRLQQPRVYSDRLAYTSASPFTVGEVQAWWFCFQALSVVDLELRLVDSIFVDLDLPRFKVNGVLGTDEPKALTRYIPTQGWTPVDTRIRVSGVADLVAKLGGDHLYSLGPPAALREIIQNAMDAVHARRISECRASDWGEVRVSLVHSDGTWLRVDDNGLGMSDALLAGPFLDFGSSYWNSELVVSEHPGLLAKGFQPIGRFGIGFFSVFMLGDVVRVITRPYREARRATRVLEFSAGPSTVPLLRDAREDEQLQDGGTRVEVLLRAPPSSGAGLLGARKRIGSGTLRDLVRWLCPAAHVTVLVDDHSAGQTAVVADDWRTLTPEKLLLRCNPDAVTSHARIIKDRVLDLRDASGSLVGRACAHSWREIPGRGDLDGALVVGGLRAQTLPGIAGVLFGRAATADRETAVPEVDGKELMDWATAQAKSISPQLCEDQPDAAADIAAVVYQCGGDICSLPFCYSNLGWMDLVDLADWVGQKPEIMLTDRDLIEEAFRFVDDITLNASVLMVEGRTSLSWIGGRGMWPVAIHQPTNHRWWDIYQRTLKGLVVETLARIWEVPIGQILNESEFSVHPTDASAEETYIWRDIGHSGVATLSESVQIIRRPTRPIKGRRRPTLSRASTPSARRKRT
jgi:hypothetical protein